MNGKEIKVVEYNLTFGNSARLVNVFSCFKYKKNNNLYVVYADVIQTEYNIIYYGSTHIKESSILSMEIKEKEAEEIIKEFIYKVTNDEKLTNFEIISLDKIEGIEIISSNKLEVKKDVLDKLIDKTIPKKETPEEKRKATKKKSPAKTLLVLLIIIIAALAGYFYLSTTEKDTTEKSIVCTTNYNHKELPATVSEEKTFNFNINDSLESVDNTMIYTFNSEDEYLSFINEGTYYKYMPESDTEGGWDKDDNAHTFKIITKERIGTGYDKPTSYEEVLTYYKNENYTCEEKLNN